MDEVIAKARQVKAAEDTAATIARLETKVDALTEAVARLIPADPESEKPEPKHAARK